MTVIAISAGHGKNVLGAMPPYMNEFDQNCRVVNKVAEILKVAGATFRGPFIDTVSKTQNENLNRIVSWHNSQQRDLDVSVHFNANTATSKPMGTECLYFTQATLAGKVASAVSDSGKLINRGAKKRTNLYFLNNTAKPAILIEVCFVDSSADKSAYDANFDAICNAIASVVAGIPAPGPTPPDPPVPPEPPARRTLKQGMSGADVQHVQRSLGLPADGQFGSQTTAGVTAFQKACGYSADGIVGPQTWGGIDELDRRMVAGSDGIPDGLAAEIDQAVRDSGIASFSWKDRGKAPLGYYRGICQSFALALTRMDAGDTLAVIMAKAKSGDPNTDALTWYENELATCDLWCDEDGPDTLRALFVMMMGLGLRESTGDHWCGKDPSATNTSADTCEAGFAQTSWNIRSVATADMNALLAEYEKDPRGFLTQFADGTPSPSTADLAVYGSGAGVQYQWLAKFSPAFHALVTGTGMRRLRQHWGPINRREVQIVPAVNSLLEEVQRLYEGYQPEPIPPEPPQPEPGQATVSVTVATHGTVIVNTPD